MLRRFVYRSGPIVAAAVLLAGSAQNGLAEGRDGNVYVMTNQSGGNAVIVYHRDSSGALTYAGAFATGGNGMGAGADPLGSQDSLVLSEDERLLLAVNAGSNSVSVLATSGDQLNLLNTVSSGGVTPVSVAVRHDLVYVLNAGGTPNINGFRIDSKTNSLVSVAGSTRDLPGGVASGPAEVSFSPEGDVLVVTEKGTNSIDTFVLEDGLPGPGVAHPSTGATPFGFAFGHDDVSVVSDAGHGPGTAAVSSYAVGEDGSVNAVTPSLADNQTAACWLVVPRNGRFAYTANAGSTTISSYAVSESGKLTLLQMAAATIGTGSTPTDMAVTGNGRFLYIRNGGNGTVSGFRIEHDGGLTPITTASGIPSGSQGIAAR